MKVDAYRYTEVSLFPHPLSSFPFSCLVGRGTSSLQVIPDEEVKVSERQVCQSNEC